MTALMHGGATSTRMLTSAWEAAWAVTMKTVARAMYVQATGNAFVLLIHVQICNQHGLEIST